MAKRHKQSPQEEAPVEPAFHVALSFAGEDRDYVEKTADVLRRMGLRVFYDKYEQVTLWGKNLYDHLSKVYGADSAYTVMFISKHYARKLWTNHERQSAQAKAFSEQREYILPARFDDTVIPGILGTSGYINLANVSAVELAELIKEKIGPLRRKNFMPGEPDRMLKLLCARKAADKRLLTSVAQGVFDDLLLLTPEERRILSLIAWNTCPAGPEIDGDIHINIDFLSRISGLTRREILVACSRIECLSFRHQLTSHVEGIRRKNILRLTYEPLRTPDELSGNWMSVVYAMFACLEQFLCPECRREAIEHIDLSVLSTLTAFPDSHAPSGEANDSEDSKHLPSAAKKKVGRTASRKRRGDGSA